MCEFNAAHGPRARACAVRQHTRTYRQLGTDFCTSKRHRVYNTRKPIRIARTHHRVRARAAAAGTPHLRRRVPHLNTRLLLRPTHTHTHTYSLITRTQSATAAALPTLFVCAFACTHTSVRVSTIFHSNIIIIIIVINNNYNNYCRYIILIYIYIHVSYRYISRSFMYVFLLIVETDIVVAG